MTPSAQPTRARVAAAALGLTLLLAACAGANSADSPSVGSSDAGVSPQPSVSLGPSPSGPSAEPSAEASDEPIGQVTWRRTDIFDVDPGTTYVTDVAAWAGGFVAVGSRWDDTHLVGTEWPAIWTSSDGERWEQRSVDLGVENLTLVAIAPRDGGSELLLVGRTPGGSGGPVEAPLASFLWTSGDAATWSPEPLPMAADAQIGSFDHGPAGYALVAGGALWHSGDGRTWAVAIEAGVSAVVAGDEGFVAMLAGAGPADPPVMASADGVSWFEADPIGGWVMSVAPLGGDWLASARTDGGDVAVWRSANGLQWSEALAVNDLTGPDGPKTGRGLEYDSISGAPLAGGAGHAFVTLTQNHCCAQREWNHGVWTTSDGITWAEVTAAAVSEADPTGALVAAVASDDAGTIVLGGHIGRGGDAAFWASER